MDDELRTELGMDTSGVKNTCGRLGVVLRARIHLEREVHTHTMKLRHLMGSSS